MRNSILCLVVLVLFTFHDSAAQCNSCDEPALFIDNQSSEKMCVTIYECEFVVNLGFPICTPVLQTTKPVGTVTVDPFDTECFTRTDPNHVIIGVFVEHWENMAPPCSCSSGFANFYLDISNRYTQFLDCLANNYEAEFFHCNDPELCSMVTLRMW